MSTHLAENGTLSIASAAATAATARVGLVTTVCEVSSEVARQYPRATTLSVVCGAVALGVALYKTINREGTKVKVTAPGMVFERTVEAPA